MDNMKVLIDGDIVAVRAAAASEERITKEVNGQVIRTREPKTEQELIWNIDSILTTINRSFPNSDFIIVIGGGSNFRTRVDSSYKANRSPEDKPLLIDEARNYLKSFGALEAPYVETDDILSILQNYSISLHDDPMDSRSVIATIDKDLDSVPGHHYNFVTGDKYFIEYENARYCYWSQVMIGDSVDNIKGIPGIGSKKAAKILAEVAYDPAGMRDAVEKAYENNAHKFEKLGTHWLTALDINTNLVQMLMSPHHHMLNEKEIKELKEMTQGIIDAHEQW